VREQVAEPLGLDVFQAAEGAYRVVNENMVDAIREVSIRRGHDPRSFALVAAGGAGPLHVGALALELDIPLVIVPRLASVFCALGGLLSDLRHEFTTSLVSPLETLDLERANAILERLRAQGLSTLRAEAVAEQDIAIAAYAELRYVGQFNEVAVPLTGELFAPWNLDGVVDEFHRRHEAVNGWQDRSHALELVNLGVVAIGKTEKPAISSSAADGAGRTSGGPRERRIYWRGQLQTVPVYDGLALAPRSLVSGPAIVEQETTTLIVPTECELLIDDRGNGLMYRRGADLESVLERLRGEA
jgi:N-methylhydantoinase A